MSPDQRNANEIIGESLLAIEGRLARIEEVQYNLNLAMDIMVQHLAEQRDDPVIEGRLAAIEAKIDRQNANVAWYTKVMEKRSPIMDEEEYRQHQEEVSRVSNEIDCTAESDVRRRSGEIDTWHPEKGG